MCGQSGCSPGSSHFCPPLSLALFLAASSDQSHVKQAGPASLNPIPPVPILWGRWPFGLIPETLISLTCVSVKDLHLTHVQISSFSYSPSACLDLGSARFSSRWCSCHWTPARHQDTTRPRPLQQNVGCSHPWGCASSLQPLPGLSRWQDGCCGAQPCTHHPPEGLCQVPVEHHHSARHGTVWNPGDETSTSCCSWHPFLGRAQWKVEEREQIMGVIPCLVVAGVFPFMLGTERAGRRSCNSSIAFCWKPCSGAIP